MVRALGRIFVWIEFFFFCDLNFLRHFRPFKYFFLVFTSRVGKKKMRKNFIVVLFLRHLLGEILVNGKKIQKISKSPPRIKLKKGNYIPVEQYQKSPPRIKLKKGNHKHYQKSLPRIKLKKGNHKHYQKSPLRIKLKKGNYIPGEHYQKSTPRIKVKEQKYKHHQDEIIKNRS
jgi:hypothetical protein